MVATTCLRLCSAHKCTRCFVTRGNRHLFQGVCASGLCAPAVEARKTLAPPTLHSQQSEIGICKAHTYIYIEEQVYIYISIYKPLSRKLERIVCTLCAARTDGSFMYSGRWAIYARYYTRVELGAAVRCLGAQCSIQCSSC